MLFHQLPPSGNGLLPLRLLRQGPEPFPAALSRDRGLPAERFLFTNSGTAAFYLALLGARSLHPDRTEVLLPAWCCPSVPQAVLQAGLTPILLDLDPDTLCYAGEEVSRHLSERTLCLLLVHFFGIPHPLPGLPPGLPGASPGGDLLVLRDCAQDFNHFPGEAGEPCFYSFGRGKSLNAGHGGALCFPGDAPGSARWQEGWQEGCQKALADLPAPASAPLKKMIAITLLSEPVPFWFVSRLPFLEVGQTRWEAPLSFGGIHPSFHAWAAACLEAYRACRAEYSALAADYVRTLRAYGGDRVSLPRDAYPADRPPIRFPLLVRDPGLRERLYAGLNRAHGGVTKQYPDLLHRLPGAPASLRPGRDFPGAARVARELLTLPVTALLRPRREAFLSDLRRLLERG